ncbi:F-box protein [Aspergillus stella-maris]|uniref:F-box protein n=1 Tax=Aspergillus stella-maris TaxID=1810926 RepID=UPI003CCD9984
MDNIGWLPHDILSLIFPQLTPVQVICCERVNTNWRDFIKDWTMVYGYEHMLQSGPLALLPTPPEMRMSFAALKKHVLIHLQAWTEKRVLVKAAVFSLVEEKILFEREYSLKLDHESDFGGPPVEATIPYLLGESLVYTGTWSPQRRKYVLEAYDFRTQARVYESDVLSPDWLRDNTQRDFHRGAPRGGALHRLGLIHDGTELILQDFEIEDPKIPGDFPSGLHIISGTTGEKIQILQEPTDTSLMKVSINASADQLVIFGRANYCGYVQPNDPEWGFVQNYRYYTIRRFTRAKGGRFTLQCTDMLVIPPDLADEMDVTKVIKAVDPFNMTALVGARSAHNDPYQMCGYQELHGCPLVPTNDPQIYRAAKEVARYKYQEVFKAPDPKVRQCYVPGDLRKFTLPRCGGPWEGAKIADTPLLPRYSAWYKGYFIEDEKYLYFSDDGWYCLFLG